MCIVHDLETFLPPDETYEQNRKLRWSAVSSPKSSARHPYNVDYLINRLHFALHLFSNRFKIKFKSGKNKNMAVMSIPHFDVICDLFLSRPPQHGIYLFYIMKKQNSFRGEDVKKHNTFHDAD